MSLLKTGTIYKIICAITDDVYIGSTFNTLRNRWQQHKGYYNDWIDGKRNTRLSIYPYFKKYGIENFKIIKIKEYECVDRRHLESKEQLWISKSRCVNKNNSFCIKKLTQLLSYKNNVEKYKLTQILYRKNNVYKIKEFNMEYRKNNVDKIKDISKKYRKKMGSILVEKKREYFETNKESILEKQKEKIDCVCGSKYTKRCKTRHEGTKKHKDYILNNP